MVIQVKSGYYLQNKPVRRPPVITPFKDKAWHFDNLARCKNVRDDVLEYFGGAVIMS
jgi:hypothetical protein